MVSEKSNGGISSRIGVGFSQEIETIKDARLRNGKSKDRVSTERITNLLTRHKSWPEIVKHIIEAEETEIEQYGL